MKILITLTYVRRAAFFKYTFVVLQYHFCFYLTLEVEGVLSFLMASCLHEKFQMRQFYYVWIMTYLTVRKHWKLSLNQCLH